MNVKSTTIHMMTHCILRNKANLFWSGNRLLSHVRPLNPLEHAHLNTMGPKLMQEPSLRQGSESHGLITAKERKHL